MHLLRHGPSSVTDGNTWNRVNCDVLPGRVSEITSKEEGDGLQVGKKGNTDLSLGLLIALSEAGVGAQFLNEQLRVGWAPWLSSQCAFP